MSDFILKLLFFTPMWSLALILYVYLMAIYFDFCTKGKVGKETYRALRENSEDIVFGCFGLQVITAGVVFILQIALYERSSDSWNIYLKLGGMCWTPIILATILSLIIGFILKSIYSENSRK